MFFRFVTKLNVAIAESIKGTTKLEEVRRRTKLAKFRAHLFNLVFFRGLGFLTLLEYLEKEVLGFC